jgi:hypothetical protein
MHPKKKRRKERRKREKEEEKGNIRRSKRNMYLVSGVLLR